ncbi:MAG: hypothetical protein ACR2GH_01765, partial [Pseudonocardia sp.]
ATEVPRNSDNPPPLAAAWLDHFTWFGTVRGMERVEIDVDAVTAAYLRRHCSRRGDLAGAASAALHHLAVTEAAEALASWYARHEAELLVSIEDGEAALAEVV